jgi:GrpB-like predicted nucleotidyltransferase (UPF0157 family)
VDHHGSTAVPGLEAKPIIDIQVSVERLQPIRAYAEPLATLGGVHVPYDDDVACWFVHRPGGWPHTHHVHVVQSGGLEERRTLGFRDFLREHGGVAREYVPSRDIWLRWSTQRVVRRAKRTPTHGARSWTAWRRSLWRRVILAGCEVRHQSAGGILTHRSTHHPNIPKER